MREGLNRRLTLIVSVAGSGKTTCLNHFFHAAVSFGQHAVWLSLDSSDNDRSRFWISFFGSLEKLDLSLLEETNLGSLDGRTDQTWLTESLGQIGAAPFEIFLVLDNYQEIKSQTIHEDLLFWIEHMPENMHLALASRFTPPFALSRLRGQDQLVEIHSDDLFLDLFGTIKFIREIKGINATNEEIRNLYELVGGWIAGLQLATRAFQSSGNTQGASLVSALGNRYIKDYLIEEVLNQQEQQVREFLLNTSILNRLSEDLCAEVAGVGSNKHILDVLVRAGLFVTPLDETGEWFRYHPLFAKILKQELSASTPGEIALLYSRASEWSERNGFLDDAIEYALSAEDDDRVIRLFERSMLDTLNKIEGDFFLDAPRQQGWLNSLPEERFSENTPFLLLSAWSNFVSSRPKESNAYLNRARKSLDRLQKEEAEPVLHEGIEEILSAIEAGNANMDGDYQHAIELSKNALTSLRGGSVWFRVTLLCLLGEAQASIGNIDESMRSYSQAKAVSAAFGGNQLEQFCSYEIGKLHVQRGQLGLALETWQKALPLCEGDGRLEQHSSGLLYIGLCRLNVFRGNLDDATVCLDQARSILLRTDNIFCLLELQIACAYLYEARGELVESLNVIAAASELALSSYSEVVPRYSAWEAFICYARIALSNGDTATAESALNELQKYLSPNDSYYRIQTELIDAMILHKQSEYNESIRVLEIVSEDANKALYMGISLEAMVVRSACLYDLGQLDAAVIQLTLALEVASEEGYMSPFMIEAPAIGELLYRILYERKGKSTLSTKRRTLCRRLLNARKAQRSDIGKHAARVTSNLSKREVDIHRLLEQGLSKQEIADDLHISLNTVKTHVKNIYKKLGVRDRIAAVQISLDHVD